MKEKSFKETNEYKALCYCQEYGIVEYKVKKNIMTYYTSYPAYLKDKRYTVKATVNLNTMEEKRTKLKYYNRNGILNR